MGFKNKEIVVLLALLAAASLSARAQSERKDSLVRLIKGNSLSMMQKDGKNYRKAENATFLHNDTYLICDTAYWYVDNKVIDAIGNVKVIQDGTTLTGDKGSYLIDMDLVQFRGTLVQLEDKDHNLLRTHNLDYNTRDSLAYFSNGASMKDKEGQIIESRDGSYDAKKRLFEFRNNVNMFTDSVFIRTSRLNYESAANRALFPVMIDFWKDDNMLSADTGWYERGDETFFFQGSVHVQSPAQEGWSDSLYFYRLPNNVLMLGNVQVQDTTRNVAAVGHRLFYEDSLAQVTLTRDASVVVFTEEKEDADAGPQKDTLYAGADLLAFRSIKKCDIPEGVVAAAEARLTDMNSDPVMEYRRKAAEAAAAEAKKVAEENAANNPELAAKRAAQNAVRDGGKPFARGRKGKGADAPEEKAAPPDGQSEPPAPETPAEPTPEATPESATETLPKPLPGPETAAPKDTLAAASGKSPSDSLAQLPPPDTTKIGFAWAVGNVKIFRRDIQVVCDSLRYNDLDSIARFYINPVVWNDGNRQYTSDSLAVLIRQKRVEQASLMGNAFIITQETPDLFDQIRATEVMAWFDSTSALRRFDALGGANAIFFLKEKDEFSLVNKIESKMMSAYMSGGELQRNLLFDQSNNNAHPLPQLKPDERKLKGFNWQPELQPKGREDITDLEVRPSERQRYDRRPRAVFTQTDVYFPGYMKGVYAKIEETKNKPKEKKRDKTAAPDSLAAKPDTLQALPDSTLLLSRKDSLALSDSLKLQARRDSIAVRDSLAARDSLSRTKDGKPLSEKELRRLAKQAEKEARWARADSIDAARAAAKLEKKLAAEAARAERLAKLREEQDVKDAARLEAYVRKYRLKYEKKKEKTDNEDGNDSGKIPEVRQDRHAERRELPEPALDPEAAGPAQAPVQGTE